MPSLPIGHIDNLVPVLMGGVAVALVSFADTSVLSRTYAARLCMLVDPKTRKMGSASARPTSRQASSRVSDQQ